MPINIHGEKSEIKFSILRQEDSFILERGKDDVLYLKLSFFTDKHMANYNYQYNLEKAKSIAEVAEETYVAIAVFDCITGLGDNPVSVGTDLTDIAHLKEPFQVTYAMLCKLCALEKELEIKFDPTQITDFDENTQDIEELFQLLVKKHIIRLNAKLTATESTKITFQKTDARLEVGENLDMTFTQEYEYLVYGQEIHIFTANYLGNAVVKKVEESEAGTYTIWYGDTDSKPMYISRTGFKTLDEARQENDRIMNRKEAYINAKMIHDYHDELGIPYADAIPNS